MWLPLPWIPALASASCYFRTKFKALPQDQKLATVKNNNACINCLRPGHWQISAPTSGLPETPPFPPTLGCEGHWRHCANTECCHCPISTVSTNSTPDHAHLSSMKAWALLVSGSSSSFILEHLGAISELTSFSAINHSSSSLCH